MQWGVTRGVDGDSKKRLEYISKHLSERANLSATPVDVVQTRNLDQPTDVFVGQSVHVEPSRQTGPLRSLAAVDRDAPLHECVLAGIEIRNDLLGDLRQVAAANDVFGLEEYFAQSALARGVVLEVESVEAVEGVVGVHVERVDGQVVGSEVQRHKHLAQSEKAAIPVDYRLVGEALQLVFDEAQQVLLVHARRVVHVGVYFAAVVEIAVGNRLLRVDLALGIEEHVQVELRMQQLQALVCVAQDGARIHSFAHLHVICNEFFE
mmetsp:Transcript_16122/g.27215  ORF Transcript_16122/g.27215 Transcript_16122/m.27215 type:complete len:264 (-) Transcript_16122:200-991(-)